MDTEYWLQRWRDGRTGWHHEQVMPLLEKHWQAVDAAAGARVLVPLCGKSLDMLWLSQQGHGVLGVELSPVAVESFLAENKLHARTASMLDGTHYTITNPPGGGIEIINGDVFGIDPAALAECTAFYDRAAMIALPPALRGHLVREIYAKLPTGSRGLLIVLEYPPHEMDGPPFSVETAEVHGGFGTNWSIEQLERRDILASQPSFSENGVTALHTTVYRITRHHV